MQNDNPVTDLQLSWDDIFEPDIVAPIKKIPSAADALVISLNTFGKVDMEFMCNTCGKDIGSVIKELRGSVFRDPERWNGKVYEGWVTAEEYLSGNLYEKYIAAKEADAKYDGIFRENVRAIKKARPALVPIENVFVTIGTPWLPVATVEAFVRYLLDLRARDFIVHDDAVGTWEIRDKSYIIWEGNTVKCKVTYGTNRLNALQIIERMLNNQNIVVSDKRASTINKSGEVRVVNKRETLLALERASRIKTAFADWLARDDKRKSLIEKVYSTKYGSIKRRAFDGSFLSIPDKNPDITLYPYQKNAIARILFSPNTLLAHEVGAGKTYIMIAAGMELKRMGIARKNMFVVPNNIVRQWEKSFKELYPNANILVVEPKSFSPKKRQSVLAEIRDGEYDGVIVSYSCFDMIPISYEYEYNVLKEEVEELEREMKKKGFKVTNAIVSKHRRLKEKLAKFAVSKSQDVGICFDMLGVNTLFVDEAHNFKNLPFETHAKNILGISSEGSAKCKAFYEKVTCVQRQNNGRGVVFATGTPITNSVSDVFIMQTYLQGGVLATLGLQSFDAWVGNFAELVSGFEIDVDASNFRIAKRFSRFHNLVELTSLMSMFADFYQTAGGEKLPKFDGYTDILIEKTKAFSDYLEEISSRADIVRSHAVKRDEDNMLKITTDGRKAALDMRLVDDFLPRTFNSKVVRCAEEVYRIYLLSADALGTQLVFCDSSTPSVKFNMYDELKRLLAEHGIPEREIAYIHDAKTDSQKEELLKDVRESKVRVLIGSTWKLGLGVNVQDHLIAVHHLDVPWRPADMVQREGRIIRQGNLNERVYIYRYITRGSFDAYSWQLLENKQRFISELLSGSLEERSGDDVGDTVLKYAEVKALAIGNPLIKERVETANELTRLITLKRRADELRDSMANERETLPAAIFELSADVKRITADVKFAAACDISYTDEEAEEIGGKIVAVLMENEFKTEETPILSYKGFAVIAPKYMNKTELFVYVERQRRYRVDMSLSKQGVATRLENFVKNIEKILQAKKDEIKRLKLREETIGQELLKPDEYVDDIIALKEKLKQIDEKLGVK